MKDTAIGYDLVHQQHSNQHQHQHQHQQHQPQFQHQQQAAGWNQRQDTHTTSIYGNNQAGGLHRAGHINQHHHHHHLNQYQLHQQIHSPGQHNSSYYPQQQQQQQQPSNPAHLYNTSYQPSQQQHPPNSAGQNPIQQPSINPQQANWSNPEANSIGQQPAVTNHSPLAPYMQLSSYNQSTHNNHAGGEQRNNQHHTNGISQTPIGTNGAPVESLYNTSAIVQQNPPAYGYNNYDAGFFQGQANNNSQGPQQASGDPQATANISIFWNQSSQPSQASILARLNPNQPQRHEPITSPEQATMAGNYMLDPRLYYARVAPPHPHLPPVFDSTITQNFNQTQISPNPEVLVQKVPTTITSPSSNQQNLVRNEQAPLHRANSLRGQPQLGVVAKDATIKTDNDSSNQKFSQTKPVSTENVETIKSNNSKIFSNNSRLRKLTPPSNNTIESSLPSKETKISDIKKETTQSNNIETSSSSIVIKKQNATEEVKKVDSIYGQNVPKPLNNLNHDRQKVAGLNSNPPPQNKQPVQNDGNYNRNAAMNANSNQQDAREKRHRDVYDRNSSNDNAPNLFPNSKLGDKLDSSNNKQATSKDNPKESKATKQSDDKLEEKLNSLSFSSPKRTTWASIASQPIKVIQPKSLKSKIGGGSSVLSSSVKHHIAVAAASAITLDTSSLDSKNLPIKAVPKPAVSSVQTKNSSLSIASKLPTVAASLKLNLLGKDSIETSKISWPAVNASIDLSSEVVPPKSNQTTTQTGANKSLQDAREDRFDRRNVDDRRFPNRRDDYSREHSNHRQLPSGRDSFWSRRVEHQGDYNRHERTDLNQKNLPELNNNNNNTTNDKEAPLLRRGNNFRRENDEFRGNNRFDMDMDRDQYREREQRPIMKRNDFINGRNDVRSIDGQQFHKSSSKYGFHSRNNNNNNNNNDEDFYNNQNSPRDQSAPSHRQINQQANHNNLDNEKPLEGPKEQSKPTTTKVDYSNFNPKTFDLEPKDARYFIIKSYSEDDIHRSIKYSIWCSTNHGNRKLDEAYQHQQKTTKDAPIYLFFSVNGSGHFCGMAQMMSSVDFDSSTGVWAQSKWQGEFSVKWIYVKDVPNNALRHITLENNEDKPVTNSRDTQEVPSEKGKAVLKILHEYSHKTSLFDDYSHYERRQEEERVKKNLQNPIDDRKHNYNSNNNQQADNGFNGRSQNGRGFMNSRPAYNNDFNHPNQYQHHNAASFRERPGRFAS